MKVLGFWGNKRQGALFDVRVFNPFAPSHANQTIESAYRKNERKKRRQSENQIIEIEHGSLPPLVMSVADWTPQLEYSTRDWPAWSAKSSHHRIVRLWRWFDASLPFHSLIQLFSAWEAPDQTSIDLLDSTWTTLPLKWSLVRAAFELTPYPIMSITDNTLHYINCLMYHATTPCKYIHIYLKIIVLRNVT